MSNHKLPSILEVQQRCMPVVDAIDIISSDSNESISDSEIECVDYIRPMSNMINTIHIEPLHFDCPLRNIGINVYQNTKEDQNNSNLFQINVPLLETKETWYDRVTTFK